MTGVLPRQTKAPITSDEWFAKLATDALTQSEACDDPALARRWVERARRIAPTDPMVALRLALLCLRDADATAAMRLYSEVCSRYDIADAWLGLAGSALQAGDMDRATDAMHRFLSRHVAPPTALQLATVIAGASGQAGWCAVDERGRLHGGPAEVVLDGVALPLRWSGGVARVPPGRSLVVRRAGVALLGSPIDLAALSATEGFVEAREGGLSGWAWHPGDPARDPVVVVTDAPGTGVLRMSLTALREQNPDMAPLARPRSFIIPATALPPGPLRVTGAEGRDLLGSPLDPGLERRSAAGLDSVARQLWSPVWADVVGPPSPVPPRARPVDVVVPVYRGLSQTLACIDSVLATLPRGSRLHVVDDCSPDAELTAALQGLAKRNRIRLIRQPANRGFPAAVNTGIAAAAGRDVVLLNSDTLVPPGWLEALTAAVRSAPGIGTACPLSNEATILSYPAAAGGNPMPDLPGTVAQAELAAAANGAELVDVPVAVGFCMFIRRECLDQVGAFRDDLFAQGYGEENDFCLRARHLGWRHVAVTGAYVAHHGAVSFGAAQRHLRARNIAMLGRLHPGYDAMIAAWIAQDPLAPARLRMDALRWRAGRRKAAVVMVTHGGGGGVDRVIEARVAALRQAGIRPIVLQPEPGWVGVGESAGASATPNLRYRMPDEMTALVRLLRADRPTHVELHHMLGHDPALLGLAERLGIPHEVHVHDYAWFCPRIALVQDHSYCGEPPISGCEACIADFGSNLDEDVNVAELVERSGRVLDTARRVVAPGPDVAARMERHFPGIRSEVVPWENDAAIPQPPAPNAVSRICVIGGIGVEKGYEILLACVRDAARRRLGLRFTLVGHSYDDQRLLDAGPIEITGPYASDEGEALIRAQSADVAFLPSIWPETWCFTLGHAWRAGLRAVVFDVGTPATRVRRSGWGWVLPLGLPAVAINDWMVRLNSTLQRPLLATDSTQPQTQASSTLRNAVI